MTSTKYLQNNMPSIDRPDTSNYFRFYGMEPSFDLDKSYLKSLFLEKTREFHPDFYTRDPEAQNIALAVSAYNNKAYKILGNDISRAQYLVELNLGAADEKQQLPQAFLMEMMELNEMIDDLAYNKDEAKQQALDSEIQSLKTSIELEIMKTATEMKWTETQMALLKWKYMERLETRVNGL
jgi:molecular chaperone HscB